MWKIHCRINLEFDWSSWVTNGLFDLVLFEKLNWDWGGWIRVECDLEVRSVPMFWVAKG